MAKFILTSRFIKNPAFANAGKLLQYMATRDGVEKLPRGIDNKPATKQQEKLINSITKKFPETKQSIEFEDYENAPTKANASEFLSYFEENYADKIEDMKTLVRYYAERPGVEKLGSHGLFSQTDDKINLDEVADEVSNHDGVVWTHVLSLHREDAERLGYNNAKAWKNLVRRNVAAIAEAHKIDLNDLQWYAAFHNTGHHPHIHLMVYSKSGQGYLTNKGIELLRSRFGNDIFRNEQYKLFEMQTEIRNELKDEARSVIEDLLAHINRSITPSDELVDLFNQLNEAMKQHKGKWLYGYLQKAREGNRRQNRSRNRQRPGHCRALREVECDQPRKAFALSREENARHSSRGQQRIPQHKKRFAPVDESTFTAAGQRTNHRGESFSGHIGIDLQARAADRKKLYAAPCQAAVSG